LTVVQKTEELAVPMTAKKKKLLEILRIAKKILERPSTDPSCITGLPIRQNLELI
jgi:hypothetical protein